MSHRHISEDCLHSVIADASDHDPILTRRTALLSALIAGFPFAFSGNRAEASKIDPKQTIVIPPKDVKWSALSGLPERSGEMATLYGDLGKEGPYVVLVKWHPGFMSAPHSYATDRLCVVVSGVWWVNSGKDFDPDNCVAAPAGSFVRRIARTPHYDGVKKDGKEPAVIAIFGTHGQSETGGPDRPLWRKL